MFTRIRSSCTYANVASSLALFLVVATGSAYAVNTVGSADIIDDSILSQDIKNGGVAAVDIGLNSVTSSRIVNGTLLNADLAPGAVTGATILDGQVGTADLADNAVTTAKVLNESLDSADLADSSVGKSEIATDGVGEFEIENDAIDTGEIVDFGLSNQDVGVLFAEVNADGTLANSSGGGVTATKVGAVGAGTYEVDFAHTIANCTAVATLGGATVTPVVPGEISVADRNLNPEAVFVGTATSAGVGADKPFRLVVVC